MKDEVLKDKIFTISNFLSVFRALLLPFFIYYTFLFNENTKNIKYYSILMFICFIAILSDFLDGLFARLLKEETVLGRYLDPVCDKIVTIGGLSTITAYFHFPFWVLLLYIFREIVGIWFGLFLLIKCGIQGKPNIWGKIGVGLAAFCVIYYLSLPLLNEYYPNSIMTNSPQYSSYLLIVIVFIGAVKYLIDYHEIIFANK